MAPTSKCQEKPRFDIEVKVEKKETADDGSCDSLFNHKHQEIVRHDLPRCSIPIVEETKLPQPPDGGYGWIIVLGSFIMHCLIGGFERLDGVFFLQFQAKFNENAQLTAWPGALSGTLRLLMAPVAAAITNWYSVRACCMAGSLLNFLGLVLTGFASNFYFLFFAHALLQGIGRCLMYAPCLIVINSYFDKRRSLAVGIATSGVGMGSFVVVPLTQLLFDTYGFTGALLITSAINLNAVVVAMLFRPLTLHYKFTQQKPRNCVTAGDNEDMEDAMISPEINDPSPSQTRNPEQDLPILPPPPPPPLTPSSSSPTSKTFALRCKGCVISVFQSFFPKEDKMFVKTKTKKIFHFYLLKDPSFFLFCISIMLFTAAFKSTYTFVPALVKSKGISDTEAAFLISIAGVSDAFGRLGVGLFDIGFLRECRPIFYNLFLLIVALVSFTYPSLMSYTAFCIVSAIYGVSSGGYVSQKSVVVVDILGVENMAISFGMLVCFQGIGSGIGPPLSGAFKDAFGSFTEVFYLGGIFMCLACVFMVSANIFLRRKQKNRGKEQESEND